jgi:hypothetical protein
MSQRKATTLVEVLVAIFIMGIGLMAVLAMFPLGALTMARAIKDDRVGHAVANARAMASAENARFNGSLRSTTFDPQGWYFDNPQADVDPVAVGRVFLDAPPDGPSYPVYADTVGYLTYTTGVNRDWVAAVDPTTFASSVSAIRRRPLSFANSVANVQKWCTLLDDISFASNGTPALDSGAVDRKPTYSWAYMMRRPKAGIRSAVDVTVVVYNQRSLNFAFRLGAKEQAYSCQVSATQPNLVTLTWGAGQIMPQVQEGGWILDATPQVVVVGKNNKYLPGNAAFYRVVSISDVTTVGVNQQVDIELAQPLRGWPRPAGQLPANPTIVVLNGVAEVIESGDSWRPWSN